MAMIQITFTPSNSAQADLIGKLMAQYLRAGEDSEAAQAVETAAVETPAPKATRARKPAASGATEPAGSQSSPASVTATAATSETTSQPAPTPTATTAETEGNAAAASSEPEAAAASPASSADSSSSAKQYTLEEVRAKLADISKAGKQQQVVALIASLGAKKLTDVPADKYGQLMAEAEGL